MVASLTKTQANAVEAYSTSGADPRTGHMISGSEEEGSRSRTVAVAAPVVFWGGPCSG
jgi:hypothetical protein